MWIDNLFPKLLGAELYRPHPEYIAEMVIQPQVVWDATKFRGDVMQLDRYQFFGDPGTKDSRRRDMTDTIGTSNSRSIAKNTIDVKLEEFTGPADPNDPNTPSSLKIPEHKLLFGQRLLWAGRVAQFHQSIGSDTLLDDYRRWRDRVFINELLKTSYTTNPSGVPDGGTYASGPPAFEIKKDLLRIVERLRSRNVPRFMDGSYRCICSPRFMTHLRQDPDFREVARYPGYGDSMMSPNSMILQGAQFGQAGMAGGQPMMPSGILFEGVRFFESTNLPYETVSLNYTASTNATAHPTGLAPRVAHLGIFFGEQTTGIAIGGQGPTVEPGDDSDYNRFLSLIWKMFGQFTLLNEDFVEVARTYAD